MFGEQKTPLVIYPKQPNGRNGCTAYLKNPNPKKNTQKDHEEYTRKKKCRAMFGNTPDEAASEFMGKNFKHFTDITECPYEETPMPY